MLEPVAGFRSFGLKNLVWELFDHTCTGLKDDGPIKRIKGLRNGKWGVMVGDVGLFYKIK